MDDRRRQGGQRPGLLEGYSLRSYLMLVDWTARLYREGKAALGREAAGILERLGTSVERWAEQLGRLLGCKKLLGTAMGRLESLERCAAARGQRWVNNLAGRPA